MYRRCGFRYEKKLRAIGVARIAGIDEAGRGALAGPVVAAAVILPERFRHRDKRYRFHRLGYRENSDREPCNLLSAKTGRPVFRREHRERAQVISSRARSGCATGSKDRRWIGQGPNSWSLVRWSSVL